ncbi:unnamed protein product [Callosobruchus maculatus]|uniref:Uncharacterized protein n=1 Tax=Callosobruchus maculatus TaxID=64391 RepID=A0A653DQG7_CALMS|nr:unnamed protein product [Callosobruchus maculatus]
MNSSKVTKPQKLTIGQVRMENIDFGYRLCDRDDIASKPVIIEHLGFVQGKNLIQELPPREVYVHYTIATDTSNIKKVFNSVHEIILKSITEGTFGNQLY